MAAKQVGPFMVDDEREFTLDDLRKIGHWHHDGRYVFVDYDGTNKEWYEHEYRYDRNDPLALRLKATRRSVLKAMVTRRDNKRRRAARVVA